MQWTTHHVTTIILEIIYKKTNV